MKTADVTAFSPEATDERLVVAAQSGSPEAFAALFRRYRPEIARYAERFRAAQVEAVRNALAGSGIDEERLPAVVALLTMVGLAQVLALEETLGVTQGHDTTFAFVEQLIGELGGRKPREGTG